MSRSPALRPSAQGRPHPLQEVRRNEKAPAYSFAMLLEPRRYVHAVTEIGDLAV